MLDFDLFRRVVDEAGPSLVRIDFFNYGEAFLHKRAIEMCEHIKRSFPHIYLYTSTNGLAFNEEQVRRLVRSGIDEVTFSIDGATAESYAIYRRRGDFAKAIRNLRAAADEKRATGSDLPFINWRYILFTHNDSDAEMAQARAMAAEHRRRSPLLGAHRPSRGHVLAPLRAGISRAGGDQTGSLGRQQPWQRDPGRHSQRGDRSPAGGRLASAVGRISNAAGDGPPGPPGADCRNSAGISRPAPSRRKRATAGAWSAWAPSSATVTAPSSTATSSAPGCRRRCSRGSRLRWR